MTYNVRLSESQYYDVLKNMNAEWDREYCYRMEEGDGDASHLEFVYGIYEAFLMARGQGWLKRNDEEDLKRKRDDIGRVKNLTEGE